MSLVIFTDIHGQIYVATWNSFIKNYSVKNGFAIMNKKVKCYVDMCIKEANYKVICVKGDNEVQLLLCAYHFSALYYHVD